VRNKITSILCKVQECERNWLQQVKRIFHNRLQRIIKKTADEKQKKPVETFKDTATHVRPEKGK
jgi:hypothetical protein